ncbi:error-prone DNA polymerase [Mycetohabitans sp. B8]|uniref:error-prone DNA polymerase n=1 Tax=Mycetohabitans sp. B8 TaxID=2841845 RepID=UPI001F389495|nr:error-prone DNA polymerase [Mycetohabitans sp. B8]MCG1042144.1 error-prone DNA polymerase [Mycetohabitans sp. B8]
MDSAPPAYAELHCLTNFSFLRGASHADELIERAIELGYTALAVTDECSLAGVVRAYAAMGDRRDAAGNEPLKLLVGSEMTVHAADGTPFCTLVVLARDRQGYGNLSELITLARTRTEKGSYWLTVNDFMPLDPGYVHLGRLPGCELLLIPNRDAPLADTCTAAEWLAQLAPGRASLALQLWQDGRDAVLLDGLRAIAAHTGLPLVAAGGVLMHARHRKRLQDTLTAIRLNTTLAQCGYALEVNSERHLRSRARLAALYPRDTLDATLEVARRCTFSLSELKYEYPKELVPPGQTAASQLRNLVYAGAAERWPQGLRPEHQAQIEHELRLIADLGYEPYFLTVHDIVSFARANRILCQGRGSAANSVVCYCLHITEVDPVFHRMLVERFISRARREPPDIDVDFEHQRREEVIQYIYAKYGRMRAALAATVISYRTRSALKDVGRALGLEAQSVERFSALHQWRDAPQASAGKLAEAGLDPQARITLQLLELSGQLRGFPRHLSQHVGGFVIARDMLSRLVPIENAAMKDRSVIEWDKDDLDALKLLKVDVLALGMLSAIRRALEFIAKRRGWPKLRMQDIPREDLTVYEMCCHADTAGVFQIESRAQQNMLPRLQPRRFYDLVVQVAIVRPGPIQGGMVHPYLRRRQGLEPVDFPKDDLKPALARTMGVPIFQEQVMQLAMIAAGYSAEEADKLRRVMVAWRRRGHLQLYQEDLTRRMLEKGYSLEFARRICAQIEGFGEYGFPESHAASFAWLVYVSAWIKRHEPAAFLAALLNSQPMGFYSPSQLVQDAKRHGVRVLPPDVAVSHWESTLQQNDGRQLANAPFDGANGSLAWLGPFGLPPHELGQPRVSACASTLDGTCSPATVGASSPASAATLATLHEVYGDPAGTRSRQPPSAYGLDGPAVRIGLHLIKGFSQKAAERIMAARERRPFADVQDLARRAALSRRELEALAAANALQSLAGHRRQAWWAVTAQQPLPRLLCDAPIAETALALPRASEGREIIADYASLGLTLNRHPLALLRSRLAAMRFKTAAQLAAFPNGRLARACGIVTVRQRPGTASGTIFVSIEDETGTVNVIVWPALVERHRQALLNARLIAVYGIWQRQGEVMHLVAKRLEDKSALLGPLPTQSRDFH